MRKLRIIPVVDLKEGEVVHAIGGNREKYEPVDSILSDSSDPLSITLAFQKYGFKELYIADLDSIQRQGDNLEAIESIKSESEIDIMVDGGFRQISDVKDYVEKGIDKVVIGTETLQNFDMISNVSDRYGFPVVASLDIRESEVIADSLEVKKPIDKLVQSLQRNGVSEIIVLDLGKVGTFEGPNTKFLSKVTPVASVPILFGGGIRNVSDIRKLGDHGISGTLIATALHSGSITREDLDQFLRR